MDALPVEVRARAVALASERLGQLAPDLVPASLRQVARFTPAKRAKAGATQLAAALDGDPIFRRGVAELARSRSPDLAQALARGTALPAVPVEEVAALAYVLRSPGWEAWVTRAAEQLAAREARHSETAQLDAVARLTEQLDAVRATAHEELKAARHQAEVTEKELTAVRRKVRELGDRAGRAEQGQRDAQAQLQRAETELAQIQATREGELRTLQERLADSQQAVQDARRATKEGRADDQLRLRLLLDTVVGATQGLRRELALPPAEGRPADALSPDYAVPAGGASLRGRSADDPTLLDAVLALPLTHLIVDGYNVTKTAYPTLSLEAQRRRLLAGLGGLVARTAAEVTVVFDGADGSVPVAVPAPRGVRLLFSRTGETADEVIRRLARHEPQGRSVVVVSSDKEIVEGVTRSGARALPSVALARLLER